VIAVLFIKEKPLLIKEKPLPGDERRAKERRQPPEFRCAERESEGRRPP
jgi:hypothetical protein